MGGAAAQMSYIDFLESKIITAPRTGFDVEEEDLSPVLKPHQKVAVKWALKGGRRALFESFGLGKTVQELEWCRQVINHEGGRALIVLPLGVKQEFTRDAVELLGMEKPEYVTCKADIAAAQGDIVITNYERVRDGDIDPKEFTAVCLDENVEHYVDQFVMDFFRLSFDLARHGFSLRRRRRPFSKRLHL